MCMLRAQCCFLNPFKLRFILPLSGNDFCVESSGLYITLWSVLYGCYQTHRQSQVSVLNGLTRKSPTVVPYGYSRYSKLWSPVIDKIDAIVAAIFAVELALWDSIFSWPLPRGISGRMLSLARHEGCRQLQTLMTALAEQKKSEFSLLCSTFPGGHLPFMYCGVHFIENLKTVLLSLHWISYSPLSAIIFYA